MSDPLTTSSGWERLPSVDIGRRFDDVWAGRQLLVKKLWVDQYAIRVSFEARPPSAPLSHKTWLLCGSDDRGRSYVNAGGAMGLADDGTYTEGVQSLTPVPPADAHYLDLGFIASEDVGYSEEPRHVVRVQIPRSA